MSKHGTFSFGYAIDKLMRGECDAIEIEWWPSTNAQPVIKWQKPDANSFMTEAYPYMEKYRQDGKLIRLPLMISPEMLNSKWYIVIND